MIVLLAVCNLFVYVVFLLFSGLYLVVVIYVGVMFVNDGVLCVLLSGVNC